MKCHLCDNWIEIQTDPKNADFVIVSGAKRKAEAEEYDPDSGLIRIAEDEEKAKLEDPFHKLEHLQEDQIVAEQKEPELYRLKEFSDRLHKDQYENNALLRKIFRDEKKALEEEDKKNKAKGIYIPLLPESEEDNHEAQSVHFAAKTTTPTSYLHRQKKLIHSSSIFNRENTTKLLLEKSLSRGVDLKLLVKKQPNDKSRVGSLSKPHVDLKARMLVTPKPKSTTSLPPNHSDITSNQINISNNNNNNNNNNNTSSEGSYCEVKETKSVSS